MDFADGRGMKVVFVPHCALNQNARLEGCAERPAAVSELIDGLMKRDIGIIQMPCPELVLLGLDRKHVHIRSGLDSRPARDALRRMAEEIAYQVRQYRSCGVSVLGVLGKNGSPSCGVEHTQKWDFCAGMGAFFEQLRAELGRQGLEVNVVGTVDSQPDAALAAVDEWMTPRSR